MSGSLNPVRAERDAGAARAAAGDALRGYAAFVRSSTGRPALLGLLGAALTTLGSFGAGAIRVHDVTLESAHLSWLRYGHGLVLSSVLFWTGIALLMLAWVRLGRSALRDEVTARQVAGTVALWVAPLIVAVPLYSRDAYSYLAQGALLRDGYDPYEVGPVVNPNGLLDDVSGIWTTTTAPYGPLFILIAKWVTVICGDNALTGTIALRLVMLPGIALSVWGVARLAQHFRARPAVSLWFAVLNPLVVVHLVGGVHNEALMVGLMVAGLVLVLRRKHWFGVAVIVAAVAVKGTAAIALPFVVWIWYHHRREADPSESSPRAFLIVGASSVAIFAALFAAFTLIAGVGLGWVTALAGSIKIINYITLPTALAQLTALLASPFTGLHLAPILVVTRALGIVALAITLVVLWWRYRQNERRNVMGILLGLLAVCVLSPASLPWYYTWPLAVAGAFTWSRRTLAIIVGLSVWLMAVFMPTGSIGLYSWWNVLLAIALGALAGYSLLHPDPLRVRPKLGLEPVPA
ncbi:Carotene biosynthesis associated membrane protein OS=Tsukamurella paurometabola (strain ATCC 8368/ DSM / CCUG 35730 / CIP 100753 / JCM 10117 / KCTC 9821/ NBRC 16120 / NCIMB 702349 / NCTC 13040) OX=521096 GN=Tpau_2667 PE=3 SV=1 [Tsukamurella paurometabola]|uniref:Alpha-(1->6)-mannopyranosyltransferase A n=1 Tax=Tsukamurella paurometabola (strain ATCC 8368 / DSM 20162 / CCUG 35730 / CIP 100753 / JCM 10117 / KCTC 9821 / NBRC 16120 / NCIMB 702349 / NCTC 13040) TaxID=521096 RepID=D5USJ6_TSUPD|nr:alpha-(1->6)-mannopyranosyltransferase A [Tsukamurella paurometabola]ADG79267.1 carotene biosynthesis associated membrane protein [Tsukamurella paurometabola DSM 20162]SUP34840.1 carotene biosynthesis associated membrane protein [Tsukamurella paurometabola]